MPTPNWFRRLLPRPKNPLRNGPTRSRLSLEALDERIVPTQLAYNLFDTAVDATGAILTGGTDPHYTTVSQIAAGVPAFVTAIGYGTGYIGPTAQPPSLPITYQYQTTFTIPAGTNLTGATLAGLVSADDSLTDIQIDGVSVTTTPATPFNAANSKANPFSINISALSTGTHTLTFVTQNGGDGLTPTGLKVSDLALNVKPRSDATAPPVLVGGGVAATTAPNGPAVPVDPNLTLASATGLSAATVRIASNFTAGDVLGFTAQSGITGSYNTTTGTLTLIGTATAAQYQAALRSVTLQTATAGAGPRRVDFSVGSAAYNPANGHFYEFVAAQGIDWGAAEAAAAGRTYFGLQGYLATVRSAAENAVVTTTAGGALAWFGASDAAQEGTWQWVTGPDAGVQFWQGGATGTAVGGEYSNWNPDQPSDSGGEDYAELLTAGQWNDVVQSSRAPTGYVVEYGGSMNDPTVSLVSSNTVNVVTRTAGPTVTDPAGATSTTATTYTVRGTAPANSVVNVYRGQIVVATQTLTNGATTFGIPVSLTANAANNFLVTANTTGVPAGESAPVVAPTITQTGTVSPNPPISTTVAGVIFVDANANGVRDAGERGVPGQVVVLDATGKPSTVTDGGGAYSFASASGTTGAVLPRPAFTDTDTTPGDGNFATVPISPVVPVFPNPDLYKASAGADANTRFVLALYRAILHRSVDPPATEYKTYTDMLPDINVVGEAKHKLAREDVAKMIWESVEHRELQVELFYQQLLGRSAAGDTAAIGHVTKLLGGGGEMDVVVDILDSDEFLTGGVHKFATDTDRLKFLLANLLGQADPTQTTLHVGAQTLVVNGTVVKDARGNDTLPSLRSIVFSNESVFRQIDGMYLAYLQREVEPGGLISQNARERTADSPTPVAEDILANPEFFKKATGKA